MKSFMKFQYITGSTQMILTATPRYNRQLSNHLMRVMMRNNPNPAQRYNPCTLQSVANPITNPNNNQILSFCCSLRMNRCAMMYKAPVQNGICGESGSMNQP